MRDEELRRRGQVPKLVYSYQRAPTGPPGLMCDSGRIYINYAYIFTTNTQRKDVDLT